MKTWFHALTCILILGMAGGVGLRAEELRCPAGYFKANYYKGRGDDRQWKYGRCEKAPLRSRWEKGEGPMTESGKIDGFESLIVGTDDFSVDWAGTFSFKASHYRFFGESDDGMRVWVDGELLFEEWRDQSVKRFERTRRMTAGEHEIRVHYYENSGQSVARLNWRRIP